MFKLLDYMEYDSDTLAQAAYVSNAAYGANFLSGGTASADNQDNGAASNAVDGNTGTQWFTTNSALPHWWKYDLGVGVTKTATKLRMWGTSGRCKDFKLQGSNNDSDWTDIYSGQMPNSSAQWNDFTFANTNAYRYYRILINNTWFIPEENYAILNEIEMMETTGFLQSYSESTIKVQGSYSLKGIAAITDSLNKTLTRTVSPTIDLTGINQVRFRIRSSRTGSNIKIGLHDSGGTTTEITPNILSANTWQEVKINLQNVTNANKDAIDQIIITIVNADAENTFYIDELISYTLPTIVIS